MRIIALALLACLLAGPARAQVINGESTEDHAYSPTPPARWSPPSGEPEPSALDRDREEQERAATERRDGRD